MNDKERELIQRLRGQNKTMTSKQLAALLGVSSRTIINYIKNINAGRKAPLILSSPEGYQLDFSHPDQFPEKNFLKEASLPQTYKERSFYIIHKFLLENISSLDVYDLCEELCISYSLLKSDIQKMNVSYAWMHVRFYCRSNQLLLEGKEKDKRKLMNHALQEMQDNDFMGAASMRQYFADSDVHTLLEIIDAAHNETSNFLNDFARSNLLIHLLIMITRLRSGDALGSSEEFPPLSDSMITDGDYQVASSIKNRIEKQLSVFISYEDYLQIAFLVKSNSTFLAKGTIDSLQEYLNLDFLEQIRTIIRGVERHYLISLENDQFLATFTLHLKNMILRNQNNRQISNPLKDDLRQASPILYDVALYIIRKMTEQGFLPHPTTEDEISFIVLHLYGELGRQSRTEKYIKCLLVMPNYLQYSEQTAQKILSRYGDELSMTTVSAMNELPEEQVYDFVVTTSTTTPPIQTETVMISSILSNRDLLKIGDAIERARNRRAFCYLTENFPYYFSEDNFLSVSRNNNTRESVIEVLSQKLIDGGYVDDSFPASVRSRENAVSTGYNGFAIPHAVDINAKQNAIAVYLSHEGISWGKHTVYVVFLMAISPDTLVDFQTLYQTLSALLIETDIIRTLKDCKDFQEFQNTMLDPSYMESVNK